MPVRQLIGEMGEVLTAITPCLMMSPLSVAQFLPADQQLFDLVIFDEASQITVPDAISAIAAASGASWWANYEADAPDALLRARRRGLGCGTIAAKQ